MVYTIDPKHTNKENELNKKENVSSTHEGLKKRCSTDRSVEQPSKKQLTKRDVLKRQQTPVLNTLSPSKMNSSPIPPSGSGSPLKPPTPRKAIDATIPINLEELNGTVVISDEDIAALNIQAEIAKETDPNYDEFAQTLRVGDLLSFHDAKTMIMVDEKIENFPLELTKFEHLKTLNLSINQISSLPDEIGQMKSLKSLDISSNQLTSVNSNLYHCNQLDSLSLSDNHITSLPHKIEGLQKLVQLDIHNNPIETLPDDITKLKHLQSLDCRKTHIQWSNLSERVQNWIKGKAIDPTKRNSYVGIFAPEPQLEITGIQIPDDKAFVESRLENRKDPEYMNLSALNLVTLPDDLGYETDLKVLNLSDNYFLQDLPESMTNLTGLEFLSFHNTAIKFDSLSRPLQDWLLDLRENNCAIVGIEIIDMNDIKK